MKENNIDQKDVIFSLSDSEFLGVPAILIKVFGDETVNRHMYLQSIKQLNEKLNSFKKDINLTVDSFDEIHKEYAKLQPEVNMDKTHEKLLTPYRSVLVEIDILVKEYSDKIAEHSPIKTKLKK